MKLFSTKPKPKKINPKAKLHVKEKKKPIDKHNNNQKEICF